MADVKSAQQLLKDLHRNDPLTALQEITGWIESVYGHADFHLETQLEVLGLLDETARPYMRKLVREYFSVNALSQFQENRTWMVLNEFFSQLEAAYYKLLTAYFDGSKGSAAIKNSLPQITARGIHAIMGKIKLVAARYGRVPPAVWEHLAGFYTHAESQGYLDQPVRLYSAIPLESSVRNKSVSVLVWYASGSATLSPPHIHLAERLTAHFCRHFVVESQPSSNSLFYFDLAHPGQPVRVTADTKPLPTMRFIGTGDVKPQIEALLKTLEKGVVPEGINLGGVYEAQAVRLVISHLYVYWGMPLPMRRSMRHHVHLSISVAQGYSKALELAGSDSTGPGAAANSAGGSLTWEVVDISATGLQCMLSGKNAEGVKIGLLLGIKPENVGHKSVGIVRRLSRDGENNLHVGVEVLSKQIENVVLHTHGHSAAGGGQAAMWLNKHDDGAGEALLLMGPDTFSMNRSLDVQLGDKTYLLIPLALLERGADYDLARYRKIEQDAGAAAEEAY